MNRCKIYLKDGQCLYEHPGINHFNFLKSSRMVLETISNAATLISRWKEFDFLVITSIARDLKTVKSYIPMENISSICPL
jgi:hypothetical protein